MNNSNLTDDVMLCTFVYCFITLLYYLVKHKLTASRFKRFLGILLIATACTLFPWGPLSLMLGFPSALLASLLVSCFLDKDDR